MNVSNQPKYIQVTEYIKEYIRSGQLKEHDRMPSEYELTKKFNVSRHTVRKAIGDLVVEGWLYTAQGKGTFVSDRFTKGNGVSQRPKQLVGVITTYIKDYIFPEIIEGIDKVLADEGYSIILGNTNNQIEKERQCILNMLDNDISALIVEPTKSALPNPNIELYDELRKKGVPILFIHGYYSNLSSSYIVEDDVSGGYEVTKHLIELGHTRIGGIFKSDDMQGHLRYQGFLKAHRELDIPIQEGSILWYTTEDQKNFLSSQYYKDNFFQRVEGMTGLVCYNDQIAIKAIDRLNEKGIEVPEDLSVVSFDNSRMARMANLTTVAHPKGKIGKEAAKSILEMLQNKKLIKQEVLKTDIIYRESAKNIK
ncbi:GntR family transcriptional regulator [Vallitalea okinawensis]|uniref:GntR family transcriptional regulator n=1 Tax=Vallitalea okinawensis TaxID=2078660 RepID=UPI001478927C|nr:GntR family transcriptional regulator [Vallitalea okinawensis]